MRAVLFAVILVSGLCEGVEPDEQSSVTGLQEQRPETGRFVKTDRGFMVPYNVTIPGTDVTFRMEPIPGGMITVGTDRRRYRVEPCWMAQHEVTWAEYRLFMNLNSVFRKFNRQKIRTVTTENEIDALTAPTELYMKIDDIIGFDLQPQHPAISMTQSAAKRYTKWLSLLTKEQYRLPSEAEWEHACRAGADTAYHFGDDALELSEYAWFGDDTGERGMGIVGQKKPNRWGLYDLHGNVAEWVLDGPDGPPSETEDRVLDAATGWIRSKVPDQRKVCGGSWELPAKDCQCTSRILSNNIEWKDTDAEIPQSPNWFTTDPAFGVGFRVVRSLQRRPRERMEMYWTADHELDRRDELDQMENGRAVRGVVDTDLPEAIRKLKSDE